MSAPIKDVRELDEGEKSDGQFFETGADATMAFDAAEEVFDFVAAPVITAMKGRRTTAQTLWRNADAGMSAAQSRAKIVGVEAFVADDTALPRATEPRFDGEEIVALALSQSECDGAPTTLDDGRQLDIDFSLGSADGRCRLSTAGIRPILVQRVAGAVLANATEYLHPAKARQAPPPSPPRSTNTSRRRPDSPPTKPEPPANAPPSKPKSKKWPTSAARSNPPPSCSGPRTRKPTPASAKAFGLPVNKALR